MNKEVILTKEDYLGSHVFYWFTDWDELFKWVRKIARVDGTGGSECRFGGNFIDIQYDEFKKLILWLKDDITRVAIAGYTGSSSRNDLIVDEVYLDPKDGVNLKDIKRKCHIYKADEVSIEDKLVRAWWD